MALTEELVTKDSDVAITKMVPKSILSFIDEERARVLESRNFLVTKINDSRLWLETLDKSIAVRLLVNYQAKEITYDVRIRSSFLGWAVHLKEEILDNLEKLDSIAGAISGWKHEESVKELWFIVLWIKIWARRNGFVPKRKILR